MILWYGKINILPFCIFDNNKNWACCWTAPFWLIGLNQEQVTLCKSHVASLPRYRLQEINSSARNMSLLTMTYLLSTSFIVSYDLLKRGSKYLLAPGEKTEFFSPNHELWEAEQTSPEAHCVAFHCKAAANRDKSGDKVFATNCYNICGNPEEMVTLWMLPKLPPLACLFHWSQHFLDITLIYVQ